MDEKWFNLVQLQTCLRSRESDPVLPSKCVIHKSHIPKVMFVAAVGVPQYSPDRKQYCNGKHCIMPFVAYKPAAKSSANRQKGAMEIQDVSVTAESFYEMLTKKDGVFDQIRKVAQSIACQCIFIFTLTTHDTDTFSY